MVASPAGDALWVVESNSEQVLSVSSEGEVTRIADFVRNESGADRDYPFARRWHLPASVS